MKHSAAIRTIGTTLALLACASMAIAGGSMSLEPSARAHAPTASRLTSPPASAAVSPASSEEAPGYPASAPHVSSAATRPATKPATHVEIAPTAPRPAAPPVDSHREDKREHGRAAPSTSLNRHRPATPRSKDSLRNMPATPGMGMLLRMGTGAGRELSLLLDGITCAPSALRSGRAPPRAGPHSTLARDPIACAADLCSATVTPPSTPAGVTLPTRPTPGFPFADRSRGWSSARVTCPAATPAGFQLALFPERIHCSRAERFEGAPA
jgi:hypothetical protein